MAAPPQGQVKISDFTGLVNNVDPRDLPPGAADNQVNACCVKVGELQVRLGLRELTFEGEA